MVERLIERWVRWVMGLGLPPLFQGIVLCAPIVLVGWAIIIGALVIVT